MSPHRLKARLDRLEHAVAADKHFIIDPFMARRMRDDYERYRQDPEADPYLWQSIKQRARAIPCPPSYGPAQRINDSERVEDAWWRRRPDWFGKPLSKADDAEEAQAIARMLAYQESPRGRRTRRIRQLLHRRRSAAEQQELDRLCQNAREDGEDYRGQVLEAKPAFERTPAEILELEAYRRQDISYPSRLARARALQELQLQQRSKDPTYYTMQVPRPCPACRSPSEKSETGESCEDE
jgi:hypothetical protein